MVCFYARLKDAAKAEESLNILLTDFARENLLTISPEGIAGAPFDVFIFDGNAAGAAGLAEILGAGARRLCGDIACFANRMEGRQLLRTLRERRCRSVGRMERQPGGESLVEGHGGQPAPPSARGKGLCNPPEWEKVGVQLGRGPLRGGLFEKGDVIELK